MILLRRWVWLSMLLWLTTGWLSVSSQEANLELYLDFETDEALDISGNERHGVVSGKPLLVQGPVGQAWEFDGATMIELNDQIFKDPDPELSIRCYIQPMDVNGERIIFDEGGAWTGFTVRIMDGMLEFATVCCDANHPPPEIVTTESPPLDEWVEIAATYGADGMFLYVDGELVGSVDPKWDELGAHGQPAAIGQKSSGDTAFGGGGGFFVGGMDEFRLYSRKLEPNEVALPVQPKHSLLTTTWAYLKTAHATEW